MGTGYWFGTGVVFEGGGNDTYKSCYFTQASGAHFCIGALIDEAGDDRYLTFETSGAAIAFGWDYTDALLVDKSGNDYFELKGNGLGLAQIRSNAFFINLGGNDTYRHGAGAEGIGASSFMDFYKDPPAFSRYNIYSNSFGTFLDIGGEDQYLDWNVGEDKAVPSSRYQNNSTWFSPPKDSPNYGYRSFGVGMDVESGRILEIGP